MNTRDQEIVEYVLASYLSPHDEVSKFKNIPIELLEYVRSYYRARGEVRRIRYRGSRTSALDKRSYHRRMQDCAKQFADRFSVYRD